MSKTLLLFDGQTVILTNDGSDSIVQSNPAFASPLTEKPCGQAKVISEVGGSQQYQHQEDALGNLPSQGQDIKSSLVQMRVNEQEVPGFVVSQNGGAATHKVLGQSLLSSEVNEEYENSTKRNVVSEGGYLQLPVAHLQGSAGLEEQQGGGGLRGDMFTITTNAQLLPSSTEGKGSSSEQQEGSGSGGGDLQGFSSLVQFPLVTGQVKRESQNCSSGGGDLQGFSNLVQLPQVKREQKNSNEAEGQEQGEPRNLSTLLAIIEGEDGTTQTIELSQEEACRLSLPHLLHGNTTALQPLTDASLLGNVNGGPGQGGHQQMEAKEEARSALSEECSPVFPEGQLGPGVSRQVVSVDGDEADVSLGPFLLIPEYNADGTISTVLQIRGSEPEVVPDTTAAEALRHNTVLSFAQPSEATRKATAALPQHNPNIQKIRLPLAPQVSHAPSQVPRKQSCLRTKAPEWRAVAMAPQAAPRASSNTYLRDIAKRTKFRNLTSFLETQQESQGAEEISLATTTGTTTTTARLVGGGRGGLLTTEGRESPAGAYTITSGSSLLQDVSNVTSARAAPVNSVATIHLPHLPSTSCPTFSPAPQEPPKPPGDYRTLTIRVNTGPINATTTIATTTTTSTTTTTATTTTTTTTTTTSATQLPPQTVSATPSIKCSEYTEGVGGGSTLAGGDATSLTSIVYCSSSGDDTPFAVHLPGGDSTKPLGSSENPIQLVQQGNTFQALQPVQERQLEQITALLQQRRITAPPTTHRDEIYDPKTNMKIVYKVVYPEDVLPGEEEEEDMRFTKEEDDLWGTQGTLVEEKRRGRKHKDWRKAKPSEVELEEAEFVEESEERKQQLSRTRSGRISRPPRHMMKDFKHLRLINFSDDTKDKDSTSFGYLDYDEYLPTEVEKEKGPDPVISDLPRRKKREMPPLTRLRYTCATCGKLYMGRIEAHYRKFPDHCRWLPSSPEDPKQSYSAIKTLSDSAKPSRDEGSEINKSVLSPTPGTQASETSGEPGLPMETLTTQPCHTQELQASGDMLGIKLESEDLQQTPARARRGRGRRKGRASRRGGRGRPAKVNTPSTTLVPVCSEPIKVLEKILSSYTSQDIQIAVGQRLFQNLSPWQLLCFQMDETGEWPQWQERLHTLEELLRECREEFHSQTEPLLRPSSSLQEGDCCSPMLSESDRAGCGKGASGSGDLQLPTRSDPDPLSHKGGAERNSNISTTVKKEENNSFKVSDYLAGILGVTSCEYQLKRPSSFPPSPILDPSPVPPSDSNLPKADELPPLGLPKADELPHLGLSKADELPHLGLPKSDELPHLGLPKADELPHLDLPKEEELPHLVTFGSGKRSHEDEGNDAESPPKKRETDSENTMSQETVAHPPLDTHSTTEASMEKPDKRGEYSAGMDCVSSALEAATCNLELSSYSLSAQLAPVGSSSHTPVTADSTPSMLSARESDIQLSVTLPHLSSKCMVAASSTTLTTSHPAPCSTLTSSLPIEIPSFSTHSTSPPTLPTCLPITSMDASFIPTSTMSQVNTMQQMPLGDMDITAEDLPRLLSEGTGLVVGGSGDGCDAPKLLDTSGDTTDLSEMLFKLQEATAGISQSQDTTLGSQLYHENISGNTPQLMSSQGLHANPEVGLSAQDFSAVDGNLNPHPTENLNMKLNTTQASGEPSMPLLTFSGALSSAFHSGSDLGQSVIQSEENKKIQAILSEVSNQLERRDSEQNGNSKDGEREQLNIGFGTSNLEMGTLEDLLKR